MKFVVRRSKKVWLKQRWFFVGVGDNGEPVFTSEMYLRAGDAYDTIDMIKEEAGTAPVEVEA